MFRTDPARATTAFVAVGLLVLLTAAAMNVPAAPVMAAHHFLFLPVAVAIGGFLVMAAACRPNLTMLALSALAMLALLASPAMAQEAATTTVDAAPFVLEMITILGPTIATILGAVAVYVLGRLASWLGLNIDKRHREAIEQGLDRAVDFAMSRAGDRVRGGIPIDLRHTAVAHAAQYAQARIPDALKHFKVTPQGLNEMVEARLEYFLVERDAEPEAGLVGSRPLRPARRLA